jgi:hypothetical protein
MALNRHQTLALLALTLWFTSLVLPTMRGESGTQLGFYVFLEGVRAVPVFFLAPVHVLCWATNIVFFMYAIRLLVQQEICHPRPSLRLLYGIILFNLLFGFLFGGSRGRGTMPDLRSLPGFYVWLLAFIVLAVAVKAVKVESSEEWRATSSIDGGLP